MNYDKALAAGWPIATGMIEEACRFVIEDRFGITGARWSPDGAEDILKLRAVVVNGDLGDYMNYYKERYRDERHLARYDPATIEHLGFAAWPEHPEITRLSERRTPLVEPDDREILALPGSALARICERPAYGQLRELAREIERLKTEF
jgi:hypothetical protein